MRIYYKLVGHDAVPCSADDLDFFFFFFNRVALHTFGDVEVSTVFLAINHKPLGVQPILFETMVFGGKLDGTMRRYHTLDEAMDGHAQILSAVKESE